MLNPTPGWVYILTNPGLPGVVKIRLTTRNTSTRSTELLREYGTVYFFALAFRYAVLESSGARLLLSASLTAHVLPLHESAAY